MSVCFDVFRMSHDGERELIRSTQSAREARELRDAGPGEMAVVAREVDDREEEGAAAIEPEDDFPI